MAKKIGGLGKGLGAFGLSKTKEVKPKAVEEKTEKAAEDDVQKQPVLELELKSLTFNPHQPRNDFDQEALDSLRDSIKQYGVLQPILVRKTVKGYELIAGERRLRAAQEAGLATIPAIVREYNDAQMTEVALIENIQREDLNPIEEAQAYHHLLSDYGLTQEMLAKKIGRSRSHIANFLRLLNLAAKVQDMLIKGDLSMGQAKPLLALEDFSLQEKAAEFIVENSLSARSIEALVKNLQKNPQYLEENAKQSEKKDAAETNVFFREAQDRLKMVLGANVSIRQKGNKQRLEIEFASQDELGRLIEFLAGFNTATAPADKSKEEKLALLRQFSTTGKFSV